MRREEKLLLWIQRTRQSDREAQEELVRLAQNRVCSSWASQMEGFRAGSFSLPGGEGAMDKTHLAY